MTLDASARWRRIQELCEKMDALPMEAREPSLLGLEPDESIRRDVLDLLSAVAHERQQQEAAFAQSRSMAAVALSLPAEIGGIRIERLLGAGGSGEVFQGRRTANGISQMVAVKRFHLHPVSTGDVERFMREQRTLAALTHPAIVRFYDSGTTADGRPYLVMELAEGRPITEFCDTYRLGLHARLRLFQQVCDAVQSAHQQGVLHLDLKPSNILVAGMGDAAYPKLVDFGTAKLLGPLREATSTEPLTLYYASPERLRGETVSPACDVFSLGVILHELISGGWPFRRPETVITIAERAVGTVVPSAPSAAVTAETAEKRGALARTLTARLRAGLDAIVLKALAHDPVQRYASAADLAGDITRFINKEPLAALPESAQKMTSVRRRLAVAAALLVVVVAVGAAVTNSLAGLGEEPIKQMPWDGGDSQTSTRTPGGPGPRVFDDFTGIAGESITAVGWLGSVCSQREILTRPPAPIATGFRIGIYSDNDGAPNLLTSVYEALYPIERTAPVFEGMFMAKCGAPDPTAWGFYKYFLTFDTPIVLPGAGRYWLGIEAQLDRRASEPGFAFWGWASGDLSANGSLQILAKGRTNTFPRDRRFVLTRK